MEAHEQTKRSAGQENQLPATNKKYTKTDRRVLTELLSNSHEYSIQIVRPYKLMYLVIMWGAGVCYYDVWSNSFAEVLHITHSSGILNKECHHCIWSATILIRSFFKYIHKNA